MVSNRNNELREGFKTTELGPLPKEWQVVKLDGYLEEKKERNKSNKPLPVYTVSNIHGFILSDSFFDKQVYSRDLKTYKVVSQGDFAYNPYRINVGSLGLFAHEHEGLVSPAYVVFRIKHPEFVDHNYLKMLLKSDSYIDRIKRFSMSRGSVRRSLSYNDLTEFIIPLPPLTEQRAIAQVLSTIQKVVETQNKIIAATWELKNSLMRYLFTYGPVPLPEADRVPLKETEIGPIPEHWEVVRLGEVTEKTKQFDPRQTPAWLFKYVDVSCISNERLRIENFIEYSASDAPHRARKVISTNDIIFATVRPYLRRVATVPEYLNGQMCSTAFCIIRCKCEAVVPSFVFQAVTQDNFVERVSENQRGSSYPAVTDKDVLRQLIPLPPVHEQQEIARILTAVDKKLETEEKRKAALQTLLKTMLYLLMTGEVRVKELEVPVP